MSHRRLFSALSVGCLAASAGWIQPARAQTYSLSTIGTFDGAKGGEPLGGLTFVGGTLYGTTWSGGVSADDGVVYKIGTGGSDFTTVASFTNSQVGLSYSSLIADSSGDLFGTTTTAGSASGGAEGGTVFGIAAGSSTITNLASLNYVSNSVLAGGVVLDSSGNLYGMTTDGASDNKGTVFEIAAGTHTVSTIATFTDYQGQTIGGGLSIDSSGNLYGTTVLNGGDNDEGAVFEIPAGTHTMSTLATITSATGDGTYVPYSPLTIDSAGNLYGTANVNGPGTGTVFEIAKNSGTVSTLATYATNSPSGFTPIGPVTLDSAGNVYGTTTQGGANGVGSVFEIVKGENFATTIASLSMTGPTGWSPAAGVTLDSAGNLYGTAANGGGGDAGTVFKVTVTQPTGVTWNGAAPFDSSWSTAPNWVGLNAPTTGGNDAVTFAGTTRLFPFMDTPYSVNSVTFASGAGAFQLQGDPLTIGSGGINQQSTSTPSIFTESLVLGATQVWTVSAGGLTIDAPVTGTADLFLTGAGTITFAGDNSWSALDPNGMRIEGGGTVNVGDGASRSSNLGNTEVYVTNGSTLNYTVASSSGDAIITADKNSAVNFTQNATANYSTINVAAGSILSFQGNATAANATINSSSIIDVTGSASLGSSTITLTGTQGSLIFANAASAGANVSVVNNGSTGGLSSGVDITQATSGISIGSLSGSGSVSLGANTLTLGALGMNDTISGTIQDQGIQNFRGGNLVKVGTGTLTLTGTNSYTGTTTVDAGTLDIKGDGTYGTMISTNAGSTLNIYNGSISETRALNSGVVNIYGGFVSIDASSGGTANIYNGTIVGAKVGDPATINVYGGTFSSAIQNLDPSESIVNFIGSNFDLSAPTMDGGDTDWTLIGDDSTGDPFSVEYVESGANESTPAGLSFNGAATAPEPQDLLLVLGGGLLLPLARRKAPFK